MSGIDEVKSPDERDSDGGETASPVSQEHHPLKDENNDVERSDSSSVQPVDDENKSVEDAPPHDSAEGSLKDEGVVEITKEMKSEVGPEGTDIAIEHHEPSDEQHDGGSTASSLDSDSQLSDERPEDKKNDSVLKTSSVDESVSKEVVSVTREAPVGEVNGSDLNNGHVIDSAKQVASSSKEEVHATQIAPVENSAVSGTVERSLEEDGEKVLPKLNEITGVSSNVVNPVATNTEGEVSQPANETVPLSSTPVVSTPGTEDKGGISDADTHGQSGKQVSCVLLLETF